ncbi:MAG: acyl-ACP desaturase [bacterium]|nr:acyl-ACP desaturase [bacterium]
MLFEHERDALAWYERQEPVCTPSFVASIPWSDVRRHELKMEFVPVIRYMRDVESFTTIYDAELRKTPTGRDPVIRAFLDRWSAEEPVHGALLHRFLGEAGHDDARGDWAGAARRRIPLGYRVRSPLKALLANAFHRHFAAVHMTWGAINELSTLNGYLRLWKLAKHPVLERILRAIAREEARHAFFYWSVARIQLLRSKFRQALTRYIVRQFWTPVGQGAKPAQETNRTIAALFRGPEGVAFFHQNVNRRIEDLPGLSGLDVMTTRIAAAR